MLTVHERPVSIMVMFAIALHLWWVLMILIDQSALNATGLASLHQYVSSPLFLATILGLSALMAVAALFVRTPPWILMLLLPQQIILMMSATGAVEAMWLAQFADGVIRPRAFIAADQMYSVLAAIGHTTAIIAHAVRRWVPGNGR